MAVYKLSGAGSVKTERINYKSMNANNQFGAMVPISSISTPSGSSNTGLYNIPNTFQDLHLVGSVLTSATNTATAWWFRLNSDAGSNYSMTELAGSQTTISSTRNSNNTILSGSGPTLVSGIPSVFQMWILNYKSTSTFKTILWRTANENNGSGYTQINTGLYRSTSAITGIDILFPGGNSLTENVTLSLYGIRTSNS
jgi:hypothetical protein